MEAKISLVVLPRVLLDVNEVPTPDNKGLEEVTSPGEKMLETVKAVTLRLLSSR